MKGSRKNPRVISAEEFLPRIRRVAYRLARRLPAHVRVEDLISAGWIGYREACAGFDPSRGRDFWTYAEWRVHGAMLDELRNLDPYGRDTRRAITHLDRTRVALAQELAREPRREELADRLGVSVEQVEQLQTLGVEILEDHTDPDTWLARANAGETLEEEERVLDLQIALQVGRRLEQAFKCLKPREERVVRAYYYEEMTEAEIACHLGVTESRICQILTEARAKLRSIYEAITRAELSLRRESRPPSGGQSDNVLGDALKALQAGLDQAIARECSLDDLEEKS